MRKKEIQLIFLSGLLLMLSFPRVELPLLVWVAFIPLLYALENKKVSETFYKAWLCGCTFYIGLMYWIVVVTTTYGRLPLPLGIFVLLLLAGYMSLYFSAPFALSRLIEKKTSLTTPLTLPFFWVTMEYLKSFLLTGFPWENIGYSLYRFPLLIQCADLTGVYGISFLVVYVNTTLYLVFKNVPNKRLPYREVLCASLLLLATIVYGNERLRVIHSLSHASPSLSVALVQANIDQSIKWNQEFRNHVIHVHQKLTEKALEHHPRLIIWPEASTPFYFQTEGDYQQLIFNLISNTPSYLLLGSPSMEFHNEKWHHFNSAYLISPKGEVIGKYNKMHLVPYGEYVPLKKLFPFIHKLVEGIGDFSPGTDSVTLNLPETSFGVLICYEIIFPDLTRNLVKKGARFLANITNDAWFGNTSAPYQHLSMATLRAVETRRYLTRAANTGISALIQPDGTIKSASSLFTEALITDTIKIIPTVTFYTAYGDVFALSATGLSVLFLLLAVLIRT